MFLMYETKCLFIFLVLNIFAVIWRLVSICLEYQEPPAADIIF